MRSALLAFGILATLPGAAHAQWLNDPTPGIAPGWLDTGRAHPHGDALRVTELNLMADTELIESFCDTQTTIMAHWAVTPPPPEPRSPSNPLRQP